MDLASRVKVTFIETRVVQDHRVGTPDEERYESGKTYVLSPRSADRWVKRRVAYFVTQADRERAVGSSSDMSSFLSDPTRADQKVKGR